MVFKINLKDFRKNKAAVVFCVLVVVILFSAIMSSAFQNNFGTIDVRIVMFNDDEGERIVGKLYRPLTATSGDPAPGILGLHGYNNDKDVERPAAIELAKAGFVVLALDQLGHGDSSGGYRSESPAPYSYYLGYEYLLDLRFVDENNTGIYGHSMGSSRARSIASAYPQHRALALQAFCPASNYGSSDYNNLLHLWSSYEEWYADGKTVAEAYEDGLTTMDTAYHLVSGTAAVDTNLNLWGGVSDFSNGSARRHSYDIGTHPSVTMSPKHTAEIVAWMLQALQGMSYADAWAIADPVNQTWLGAELFGMLACFATLISILPLAYLLMNTRYFSEVRQPMPEKINTPKGSTWWIAATINTAIAGLTYWFFIPGYGNTGSSANWLFDVKIGDYTVFNHGIANGFEHWYLLNATIGIILWTVWYIMTRWRKGRDAVTLHDVGVSYATKEELEGVSIIKRIPKIFNGIIISKTILIAVILFGWMYGLVFLSQTFLNVEFRGFWTMMKTFSDLQRAVDFWPYFGIVLFFSLVNAGVYMYGQLRMKEYKNTYITHTVWFLKYCYLMLGGLVVVMLVQYAPQWFGLELTSRNMPAWELGGVNRMMIIQLMGGIPSLAITYFLSINLYRQTGRIYLSAIMFAAIQVWFQMTALVAYV
ncbi:MAG: alpha/beta hydrolase [Candidatus Lokiarchaeota archaeon]|nr:alpha/beta hydrolase [Candidatus Lokiarchaeota archaeon]